MQKKEIQNNNINLLNKLKNEKKIEVAPLDSDKMDKFIEKLNLLFRGVEI